MKKIIAAVLTIAMVMSFAACGKSSTDIVGDWTMKEVVVNGETQTTEEFAKGVEALGMNVDDFLTLTFNDDGTYTGSFMGVEVPAESTYKLDGSKLTMTSEGQSSEAEFSDGEITLEDSGTKLVLEKK